jgi:hypothetical protein
MVDFCEHCDELQFSRKVCSISTSRIRCPCCNQCDIQHAVTVNTFEVVVLVNWHFVHSLAHIILYDFKASSVGISFPGRRGWGGGGIGEEGGGVRVFY